MKGIMQSRQAAFAVVLLVVLGVASIAAIAEEKPAALSNKWRIQFNGSADSAGDITFTIGPAGAAKEVKVTIPEGKSENSVASLVRDGMKAALGDAYNVERDDYENTLVKSKGSTPDFEVKLACSSVPGLMIRLKKE